MKNVLKETLQSRLLKKAVASYDRDLKGQLKQLESYNRWMTLLEKRADDNQKKKTGKRLKVSLVCVSWCGADFNIGRLKGDIVVIYGEKGRLEKNTAEVFSDYFLDNPKVNIAYADEDVLASSDETCGFIKKLQRTMPVTKPCWSEDTLLSFQYFQNIFAFRKNAVAGIEWLGSDDPYRNLYDFILKATDNIGTEDKPGHIEKFLFHKYMPNLSTSEIEEKVYYSTKFWGVTEDYNDIKNATFKRRGVKAHMEGSFPVFDVIGEPLVSIIIPSKDNPKVLRTCISSIYKLTSYKNFEVLVIDNGSKEENKQEIESMAKEFGFKYFYEPMDFNFSRMCNNGVEKSKGEYILYLNDDMEILQADWMTRMLGQAMQKNTGAVGAKLMFPNSNLIQHCGISNTFAGPGHKLREMEDDKSYYFGRNKLVYDLIGVTAACLMVERSKLQKAGLLFEGLRVAYNDVDLNFNLLELGYNNVQRNDVVLYHYESLSRGNDLMDEKKLARLTAEKEILYKRHPLYVRHDPYLADMYNTGITEIALDTTSVQLNFDEGIPKKVAPLPPESTMNHSLVDYLEEVGVAEYTEFNFDAKFHYKLHGWCYIPGMDNARFKKKILLQNEQGEVYEININRYYREDATECLKNIEKNIELSGFYVWLYEGALPKGKYNVWLYAKDVCSRLCMYKNTEKVLEIK